MSAMPAGGTVAAPRATKTAGPPARAIFRDEQVLRAADLSAEQAHRVDMRRRHNVAAHTWGIVTGLALSEDEHGVIYVQPGMAVDGYGRELRVPEAVRLGREVLDEVAARWATGAVTCLQISLMWCATPGAAPQDACERPGANRWREDVGVWITPAPEDPDAGGDAEEDAAGAAPDVARRSLSLPPVPRRAAGCGDDPAPRFWPVCLGRVCNGGGTQQRPQTWRVDCRGVCCRPYTALVGARVAAPSGTVDVAIEDAAPGRPPRFVVRLRDPGTGVLVERLSVDRTGAAEVHGRLHVRGKVEPGPSGGTVRIGAPPPGLAPASTATWRIYRALAIRDGQPSDELRIALPGPDQGGGRLVIRGNDDETLLSVTAHGSVEIPGRLAPAGPLVLNLVPA